MRGDQFFNMGYGSDEDDEDDEYDMDLSGFMGGAPSLERPKVTPRARTPRASSANIGSGPESTAGASPNMSQPIGTTANVGYNYNVPPASEGTILSALHPLQADDNSFLGARTNVLMKSAGVAGLVLTGTYALGKRGSGGIGTGAVGLMTAAGVAYTGPVVGWNHGVLSGINSKPGRYGASIVLHGIQFFLLKRYIFDAYKNRGIGV